jgi:hypothetical protein
MRVYGASGKSNTLQRDIGFRHRGRDSGRTAAGLARNDGRHTGIWRNIGERFMAVRHLVTGEEIFLANYSDANGAPACPERRGR